MHGYWTMEHALRAPPQHVSSVVRLRILLDSCTWPHAAQHDMLAMPADWLQRSCPLLECASTQIPLGTRLWFMRPGWSSEPVLECYRKGLSIDGHLLEMHMCWEVYNGIVAFCPDLRLPSLLRPSGNRAVVTGNHKQSVTSAFIHLLHWQQVARNSTTSKRNPNLCSPSGAPSGPPNTAPHAQALSLIWVSASTIRLRRLWIRMAESLKIPFSS